MTKRKVQKQEEAPAEPTTLDRLNEAADRLFGESFASVPEQIADYLNNDPLEGEQSILQDDVPEVPDLPEVEAESEDVDVD